MKKIIYAVAAVFITGMMWVGCTDNFDDINRNRDKLYNTSLQLAFPGTVYRTMNLWGAMNYPRLLNYGRGVSVGYAEPSYGESDMNGYSSQFYVDVLRDLLQLETAYEGNPDLENRLMIIKTWKAFVFSMIAACWGPSPMSDAMMTSPSKLEYKYDTEKDIYIQVLDLLKTASEGFNPTKPNTTIDFLNPDPVFGGTGYPNIEKWRKFANTLRLDVALRIENIDRALSEQHAKEAMAHEDWFIASTAEMVQPSWGTDDSYDVSYYYNRFLKNLTDQNLSESTYPRLGQYMFTYLQSYYDPRLDKYADKPDYSVRLIVHDTIYIVRKSDYSGEDTTLYAVAYHSVPYAPAPEPGRIPQGWDIALDPNSLWGQGAQGTQKYPNPYGGLAKQGWAYVNKSFLKKDAKVVFMNWATACFLKAEAKLKYGVGSKSVQQYYEDGIAASFGEYEISGAELATYMARDGIKWGTNGKGMPDYMMIWNADINGADSPLEQIIKQRWIAEYFNGLSQWTTERRTRIMKFPPFFYSGSQSIEGSNGRFDFIPERYIFPVNEQTTNGDEYYKAIQLLQNVSPKGDPSSRWGDNMWTHLQFANVNPGLADAEAKWTGRVVVYNQLALLNRYGKTEEDMIKIAQKEFPQITDTTGLKTYLKYSIEEIIGPRP
jgi:hypothetical protein